MSEFFADTFAIVISVVALGVSIWSLVESSATRSRLWRIDARRMLEEISSKTNAVAELIEPLRKEWFTLYVAKGMDRSGAREQRDREIDDLAEKNNVQNLRTTELKSRLGQSKHRAIEELLGDINSLKLEVERNFEAVRDLQSLQERSAAEYHKSKRQSLQR